MFDFEKQNEEHLKKITGRLTEASKRYKRVFSGEDGQWILEDLAKRSFDRISTYDPDSKKMNVNEGRRSLFNYIRTMIERDLQSILEDLTK